VKENPKSLEQFLNLKNKEAMNGDPSGAPQYESIESLMRFATSQTKKLFTTDGIAKASKLYRTFFGAIYRTNPDLTFKEFNSVNEAFKTAQRKHRNKLKRWLMFDTPHCHNPDCQTGNIPQTITHMFKDCPATKIITTEAINPINNAIAAATKKPLGFVNLFTSDITKPTTELPETLMYWMLLGYLPKHIDMVATIIRNCDSKHPLAKSSAIIKLLLQSALRVHKKIAHSREMHNDAYFRQKCELQRQIDEQNASDDDEQSSLPVMLSPSQHAFISTIQMS
jgi:hypothetical protein